MRCDEVVNGEGGANAPPAELRCTFAALSAESSKPKGIVSWVSAAEAVRAEVRLYSHLFAVDSPDDKWEQQVRFCGDDDNEVYYMDDVSVLGMGGWGGGLVCCLSGCCFNCLFL